MCHLGTTVLKPYVFIFNRISPWTHHVEIHCCSRPWDQLSSLWLILLNEGKNVVRCSVQASELQKISCVVLPRDSCLQTLYIHGCDGEKLNLPSLKNELSTSLWLFLVSLFLLFTSSASSPFPFPYAWIELLFPPFPSHYSIPKDI